MTPASDELTPNETSVGPKSAPKIPSIHTRAAITWIAIFPMVALGMSVLAWFAPPWHPVIRSLVLTLIVVPLTVYVTVPALLKAHHKTAHRTWRKPRDVCSKKDGVPPNRAIR